MSWFKRQMLKRALEKAWSPHVKFDFSKWGFEITLIDSVPVRDLLEDIGVDWEIISRLAFEITNEIIEMVYYEIDPSSIDAVVQGVTMYKADEISAYETRELNRNIREYESMDKGSNIMDIYIDYILTRGHKHI